MKSRVGHKTCQNSRQEDRVIAMTATQAAKRLGISRNILHLRVKELKVELIKRGRNSMICEEGIQRIKEV